MVSNMSDYIDSQIELMNNMNKERDDLLKRVEILESETNTIYKDVLGVMITNNYSNLDMWIALIESRINEKLIKTNAIIKSVEIYEDGLLTLEIRFVIDEIHHKSIETSDYKYIYNIIRNLIWTTDRRYISSMKDVKVTVYVDKDYNIHIVDKNYPFVLEKIYNK